MKRKCFTALMLLAALLALAACSGRPQAKSTGQLPEAWPEAPQTESTSQPADALPETAATPEETAQPQEDVLYVGEKYFATQLNDIYWNPEDYEDKTIRYQGIYMEGLLLEDGDVLNEDGSVTYSDGTIIPYEDTVDPATGEVYRYVFRYTDGGCCGNDGIAGIELTTNQPLPQPGDWVEVTCKVTYVDVGGRFPLLRLLVSNFEVLEERGAEWVPN